MPALHTVNKSPFERDALTACLARAAEGSTILLIEDGVTAALAGTRHAPTLTAAAGRFSLAVLGPDLAARGLAGRPLVPGVKVVDYDGFVDLAADSSTVVSWL
ncbi:sulfurtransferase complex subunit TusB [Roseospirillum parvum]|uniref:tRNA 2-thiouridine synthesizing protein B n=1 Tax=Roseospirillum parvum TaxID=83401 RepID=A0A1G7W0W2_9PROT|nr:sulfurtransferase complex subunit TusB [Roseospirillum parvum]SDG65655.1 tRNA 2-thiouridine synthesizing protein B [Roseospirillum parvum]